MSKSSAGETRETSATVEYGLLLRSLKAQAGPELTKNYLKLLIFRPVTPKCWDYRHVLPATHPINVGSKAEIHSCKYARQILYHNILL